MEQIDVTPNGKEPNRPMDWLKEEITLAVPRYGLVLAAVAALVLAGVAID